MPFSPSAPSGLFLRLLFPLIAAATMAIENLNPRPSQFVNEVESVPRFQSPSKSQDRLLLIGASGDSILIGGRNSLFNLSSSNLEQQNTIQWKAPGQTIEECHMKGKSESECHNFIRVATTLQNGRLLLCGTHAFSPQCREYELSGSEDRWVERGQFSGQAISPYDPAQNSTFVYVREQDEIFVGAISDFNAMDPLIYRKRLTKGGGGESLRTQKDDRVIDEPNFVGSFPFGDYVYFWYREKAADAQDNNRETQYYARVGRVCANDPGGPSPAQDRWSSFLKARLNCSIQGHGAPFYFNEIQAISQPIPVAAAGGAADAMVYAIFQTSRALPMSAVCAFRMSQIDAIFDHGRFKTQRSPTSLWTPFQKFYQNPTERPGRCVSADPKQLADITLISKNPLMYEPVGAIGNGPMLIEGPNRAELTAITVAAQIESVRKQKYNILFLGRADGTISKLVETSQNGSAFLVETVRLFKQSDPIAATIMGMRVLGGDGAALVAATLGQMAKVPLQHCSIAENCGKCVGLRDPHCAWDIELRKCVNRRDWDSGSYVQNVLLGISEQCPGSTNLFGSEGGAAYVIDEDIAAAVGPTPSRGWAAPSAAANSPHLAAAGDPDGMMAADSTLTQSGLEPGSLYSASSLSVLVLVVLVATLFGFLIGWRISKWRMLSKLARNASPGSSTSSNSSDYAAADGPPGSVRTRLARQDSAEHKMMFAADTNVYSVGPRSVIGNGDTVSLVMSQRGAVHHHHHMVPLTSISTGASRAASGFATPRHDARYQTATLGATLPRDYRVKKVYL